MDIISMAQQARPKPRGQMELLRAQFTALSSWVKMMPSSWRSLPKSSGLVRVTLLPRVVAMCASAILIYFDTGRKDIQTGVGLGEQGVQRAPGDRKRVAQRSQSSQSSQRRKIRDRSERNPSETQEELRRNPRPRHTLRAWGTLRGIFRHAMSCKQDGAVSQW